MTVICIQDLIVMGRGKIAYRQVLPKKPPSAVVAAGPDWWVRRLRRASGFTVRRIRSRVVEVQPLPASYSYLSCELCRHDYCNISSSMSPFIENPLCYVLSRVCAVASLSFLRASDIRLSPGSIRKRSARGNDGGELVKNERR